MLESLKKIQVEFESFLIFCFFMLWFLHLLKAHYFLMTYVIL